MVGRKSAARSCALYNYLSAMTEVANAISSTSSYRVLLYIPDDCPSTLT